MLKLPSLVFFLFFLKLPGDQQFMKYSKQLIWRQQPCCSQSHRDHNFPPFCCFIWTLTRALDLHLHDVLLPHHWIIAAGWRSRGTGLNLYLGFVCCFFPIVVMNFIFSVMVLTGIVSERYSVHHKTSRFCFFWFWVMGLFTPSCGSYKMWNALWDCLIADLDLNR